MRVLRTLVTIALFVGGLASAGHSQSLPQGATTSKAATPMQVAHHLITMYHLAVVRGSLIEAEADLKQALKIQERLEPDSIDIANRLRDLADVARAHGDFKNAESYLRQCLKLQEKLAPDSLEIATTLAGFGMLAHVRGYLNEAENFYKKSMKIRERLAPNSMEVAISLRNLGDVAKARADFAKAETYYRRCLDLQQKLSPDSIPVSISLDLLGTLALMRDNLLEAEADLKRSLSIQERLEPGSLDVAACLCDLGNVAKLRGDFSSAESYYRRCLELQKKIAPGSMQVAYTLDWMSYLAIARGDLIEAEADRKRCLEIEERQEPGSIAVANNLRALGELAQNSNDIQAAQNYYEQCLHIQQKRSPGSVEVAQTYAHLGILTAARGDPAGSEAYHKRSLEIEERLEPGSMDVAMSLRNLGDVAKARSDFGSAETYYRRCLDLQQKLSPDSIPVSISLDLLGTLALMRDNLLEAEADLKQSLSIQERLEPGSLDVASSLRNLGDVARARGDLSTAEAYYQQCVDLRQKFAPTAISMAVSLGRLSDVEAQRQELVAAERHAQQAWEIVRSQYDTLEGDAARLTYRQGNQPHVTRLIGCWLALHQTEAAFATLEQGRARVLQQLLMDHHLVLGAEGDPTYLRYRAATRRQGRAVEDLDHARVQCDIARHALDRSTARRDAVEAATLRQALEAAKQRVGMATSAEVRARLEVDDLYCELRRQSGSRPVPPISIEQARASLPTDTLFAAFAVGEQQSYLFLISRDAPIQAFTLNITHKALESEVKALRDRITDAVRYTPEECARAGRQLYGTLFPQEAQVDLHQVKRLIISPEGSLWEAPFAALVTKELKSDPATAQAVKSAPNTQRSTLPALSSTLNTQSPTPNAQRLTPNASPTWLGLQMPITYANSLTLFAYSRSQRPTLAPGQAPTALVVGDCLFARNSSTPRQVVARRDEREGVGGEGPAGERSYLYESGEPPQRLPATGEEARSIAHLYGVAPLLDEQATEAAVRSRLPQADVIHLATHGVLRQEVPLASGVLLTLPKQTRANTPTDDDGDLQTWEIAALKLKAELVVLSACKTGLGAQVTGEGLIGLTRALQIAGCRSVVTSQWSVEDTSTSALMVAFHSGLRQGLTKDVALQQAMRSIAEAKDGRTAHPHYWAAFVLTGDPDNPNLASRP